MRLISILIHFWCLRKLNEVLRSTRE